jgi:ABC-type multidrug transport system fused ATPase/permease subunit
VLTGIASLMRGRTTLMITHSMALARSADLVAVLADGRLVELADPATLLARDSEFRRMWETQQAADVWSARGAAR